jgi:predicted MFS family arabinose efflux permease
VLERIGWAWSFVGMAAALLLLALPAWRAGAAVTAGNDALTQGSVSADVSRPGRGTGRDPDGTASGGRDPEDDAGNGAVVDWMRRRRALAWLGVLVAVKLGDALSGAMVRPMLVDAGYDLAAIGATLGVAGSSAALVGASTGGAVVQRIGRTRALVGFGALQALVLAGWAFVGARPAAATVLGLTVAENLVGTVVTVALFTAMMDAVRPRFGGSDYTVQASTVVVVQGVGALASGWMAEALGYPAHFGLAALLALGGVAAVWRFGEGRRVWGHPTI